MFERLNLPEPVPLARQSMRVYKDHRDRSWPMTILNTMLQTVSVAKPDGTQLAVIGSVEWESGTTRLHVRTLDNFHGRRTRRVVRNNMFRSIFRISNFLFESYFVNQSEIVAGMHRYISPSAF
jgi:hypothetical protein